MAKKVKTWLTDDKEAASDRDVDATQTVEFGLDGQEYEIDLCDKNALKLRSDIEQWTQFARKVGAKSRATTARSRQAGGMGADGMDAEQRQACREWLRKNTEEWANLPDRGRLPAAALAAFHARPNVA